MGRDVLALQAIGGVPFLRFVRGGQCSRAHGVRLMNRHGLYAFPRHSATIRCLAWVGCGRILLGNVRCPAAFDLAAGHDPAMPVVDAPAQPVPHRHRPAALAAAHWQAGQQEPLSRLGPARRLETHMHQPGLLALGQLGVMARRPTTVV